MDLTNAEYQNFFGSDFMQSLSDTAEQRFEEEMSRPRVEIWPEDGWQRWVSSHEQSRRSLLCSLPSMKASPYCAIGLH